MSEQLSGNPGQVPYTPTTEEVRQLAPLTDEEFDRWLADIRKQERERIIALLETKLTTAKELFDDSDGFESHVGNRYSGMIMAYETAIDLIKGEEQ